MAFTRGLAAALVAIVFVSSALAQTVIQSGPWVGGHAPVYPTQGGFSTPFVQDSGPAGGGSPSASPGISEGLYIAPNNGTLPAADTGTGPYSTNWCDYDAPVTNPSGYHFLCLSPNAQGGGLIAYGAVGAATEPFQLSVNGTTYQFPFVIGGIVGPPSTTVGDLATWNNTTGTLVADTPVLSVSHGGTGVSTLTSGVPLLGNGTGAVTQGLITVPNGGTGVTTLSAGLPLFGNGTSAVGHGTLSGNTTELVTTTGAQTSGSCVTIDSGGNHVASGNPCYVASIPNASGSAQFTSCTMSAASHTASIGLAKDFANNQGFRCNHAGAAFTLNQATGLSVTPQGTTGSTTYQYKIASIDANGGVGAATTLVQTTTGNAALSASNWNLIEWTPATGTAPIGYAIYKNISGTFTLIGIGSSSGFFGDYGYTAWPYADWLPSTAPASALADALVTTISAGGGTTTLTLVGASTTAATTTGAYHDDTAALQAALNANTAVQFPSGTFYVSSTLSMQSGQLMAGQHIGTNIISAFIGENVVTLNFVDRVSNLTFELLPLSSAVYGNGVAIIWVDNLYCEGSSTGGVANSNCVDFAGGYQYNVRDVSSDYWPGVTGVGNGGMPPTMLVDYNSGDNNTSVFMTNINVSNDGDQPMGDGNVKMIIFDTCYNCSLSHSYLNGQNPVPTKAFGGAGVEMQGGSQALYMVDDQLLNFQTNIRMDTATSGSPLNLNVVDSHFDFCQQYCILGQAGQQINVSGSSFVGEGNSPWLFANNAGIHTATGFNSGPNLISGNGFNNFNGAGAAAITFTDTMTNTSVFGNQFLSNTTNISGGGTDSSSALGPSCAAGVPSSSFYTINGVPGHC